MNTRPSPVSFLERGRKDSLQRRSSTASVRKRAGSLVGMRPGGLAAPQRASKKRELQKLRDAETLLEEAPLNLVGDRAHAALEAMLRALDIRRTTTVTSKKLQAIWHHVKALVVTANREGLRRAYAAHPAEEGHFFLSKALTALEYPGDAGADGGEFSECPLLRSYLMGVTLNNIAFQQYTAGESFDTIIKTLQRALKVQVQAFRTMSMYNMAVVMLAARRFEDATELIARCNQLASVCLELEVPASREIAPMYAQFHTMIATHAIMCHHLLAGLAAWSGERHLEVYHTQLALCCANKFLPGSHTLTVRCTQRLIAAKNGDSADLVSHNDEPPRMQMVTDNMSLLVNPLFMQFLQEVQRLRRVHFPVVKGLFKTKKLHRKLSKSPIVGDRESQTVKSPVQSARHDFRRSQSAGRTRLPALPAVIEELRREGALEPPTYGVYDAPTPPRPEGPAVVTCVPETAYKCYKVLRKDIRGLMGSLGRPQTNVHSDATEIVAPNEQLQEAFLKRCINSPHSTPAPGKYLRVTDRKLRSISALIPDFRFEKILRAAILAQCHWRGIVSRRANKHRLPMVLDMMARREAAEIIQHAYRNRLATREAIKEKYALLEHRAFVRRLTLVQQFFHEKQSAVCVLQRGLEKIERLKREIIEAHQRVASSIRIQSAWRMCAMRIRVLRLLASAIRVQSVWRGHVGRVRAREERVRRRLREQDRLMELTRRVRPLQKWWKKVFAVLRARAVVEERRKRVLSNLMRQEEEIDAVWKRFKSEDNPEMSVVKILNVLRGYRGREECAQKYSSMLTRRRFLLCLVWQKRAKRHLDVLRKEVLTKRMLHRRREEVMDAVILIQCAVRRWFAYRRKAAMQQLLALMHSSARKIQTAYKLHVGRRLYLEAKLEAKVQEELRMVAQLRHYSASKIQATWRMFITSRNNRDYFHFIRCDRHRYATIIKRAWIRYKEQRRVNAQLVDCLITHQMRQNEQLFILLVRRAQSVIRMFLDRNRLARSGRKLPPTQAHTQRCARLIQCAWRRHAAYAYVQQLRFSRAFYDQQKVNEESLHTYAKMIQSLVRGKIINPRLVAARQCEIERLSDEEKQRRDERIRSTYAYFTKENLCRRRSSLLPSGSAGGTMSSRDEFSYSSATPSRHMDVYDFTDERHSYTIRSNASRELDLPYRTYVGTPPLSQITGALASDEYERVSGATISMHRASSYSLLSSDQIELVKSRIANANRPLSQMLATGTTVILSPFSTTLSGPADPSSGSGRFSAIVKELREEVAESRSQTAEAEGWGEATQGSSTFVYSEQSPAASVSSRRGAPCYDLATLLAVVPLMQRCGRGLLSRVSTWRKWRQSDRWRAAVEVQRMWRGFSARQLVEVYYEFYTEVEVASER
uniref:Uncharacterized protein TCIL3000_11_12550 n=1 Tax=Trypanosoma congolense (strain IL3000) TaxID=1068625 RepID=G0V287_TRYCI|nr:unnamed protein product [Trypanosoma congolense IL3000]